MPQAAPQQLDGPLAVVAEGFIFNEGPRWHGGRLYFSDTLDGSVYALETGGASAQPQLVAKVDDHVSGLGFAPNGDLLIVSAGRRQLLRQHAGALSLVADLSSLAAQAINDMVVDSAGRAYIGELRFDANAPLAPIPGKLFLVQADGSVEIAADNMLMSNGTVISADGRTLIVAETMGNRLSAFAIDGDGRLSDRRCFAQLPEGFYPDGIALDEAGGIWAACPHEHGVIRVEEGGRITHMLPSRLLGAGRAAYACIFGGAARRTLYVCTAATHDRVHGDAVRSSRMESIEVGFRGAGLP